VRRPAYTESSDLLNMKRWRHSDGGDFKRSSVRSSQPACRRAEAIAWPRPCRLTRPHNLVKPFKVANASYPLLQYQNPSLSTPFAFIAFYILHALCPLLHAFTYISTLTA
jgi:hypothetical protein